MRLSAPRCALFLAAALLLGAAPAAHPQQTGQPSQPLDQIIQHFAEKESEYATAHALYRYRLHVKVQELDADNNVLGDFEESLDVGFDPSGRRRGKLVENPRIHLVHLGLKRVELDDLNFIPLFILSPAEIRDYDIRFLSRERVDEVNTYVFRIEPRDVARPGQHLFDGIVWVDANKLDIVRALGRSEPESDAGPFQGYFHQVEIYRQPVDDYMFPTYVSSDDVLSAREGTVNLRLIVRFTDFQRVDADKSK